MKNRSENQGGIELRVNVPKKTLCLEGSNIHLDDNFVDATSVRDSKEYHSVILQYDPKLGDEMYDEAESICELLRSKGRELDKDIELRPSIYMGEHRGKYMVSPSYDDSNNTPYISIVGDFKPTIVK